MFLRVEAAGIPGRYRPPGERTKAIPRFDAFRRALSLRPSSCIKNLVTLLRVCACVRACVCACVLFFFQPCRPTVARALSGHNAIFVLSSLASPPPPRRLRSFYPRCLTVVCALREKGERAVEREEDLKKEKKRWLNHFPGWKMISVSRLACPPPYRDRPYVGSRGIVAFCTSALSIGYYYCFSLSLSLGSRQVNRSGAYAAPVRATSLLDPSSSIRDYSLVQSAHLPAHPFVRTQSLTHASHENAESTQVTVPPRSIDRSIAAPIDRERKQSDST